jgi:hypothetical protein
LATRCEDKGDHWLINGSKVWTSYADKADWCFCLVRTDTAKKHEGISFLLINMRTPGVEVRPILLINGTSPFCETFFTDVVVPKNQLFGPLNGGWTVAKRLLQFVSESEFQLVETLIDRIAQIILTEFDVPQVKVRVNKQGALRGSRDVGIVIERRREDYPAIAAARA